MGVFGELLCLEWFGSAKPSSFQLEYFDFMSTGYIDQLKNFFEASVALMTVMARACGHNHLNQFNPNDLATWNREMAHLSGIKYSGYTLTGH